jgi:hypothetical protein
MTKREESIIERMDKFCTSLLDGVQSATGNDRYDLAQQLQVFDKVAAWVKIKHSLDGGSTEGSMIRELKQQIQTHADQRESSPKPAGGAKPSGGRAKPGRPLLEQANDLAAAAKAEPAPSGLAALKSSLPGNGAGHPVGGRHDALRADNSADERHRSLHSRLLRDAESDPDDADGGGDI